jgi:hypothetical protein
VSAGRRAAILSFVAARGPAVALLGAALWLSGCLTLTPEQKATLADYQERANKVTAFYGVGRVAFLVGAHNSAAGGTMRSGGLMTMEAEALDRRDDVLVAHELGHWVLDHAGRPVFSVDDRYRREMDANAEAVKILVVGWNWTEERGFRAVLDRLWRHKNAVDRRAAAVPDGHHPDPCVEISDLVRRYPQYAELSTTRSCR